MGLFDDSNVRLNVLKQRAYNYRWAEVDDGVIPLTAADPDFPVAEPVRQAMIDYINGGYFSYTPKLGLPEFKQAISDGLKARKGEVIDPELILPIDSAARGMYVIARTVLAPGDEMIVFDPVDYLFRESCLAAGGEGGPLPRQAEGRLDRSVGPGKLHHPQDQNDRPVQPPQSLRRLLPERGPGAHYGAVRKVQPLYHER